MNRIGFAATLGLLACCFLFTHLTVAQITYCNTETQFTCCECNTYNNCQPSAAEHSLCTCSGNGHGECSGGGDCRRVSGHLECVTPTTGIDAMKEYPFLFNTDFANQVFQASSLPEAERLLMKLQLHLLAAGVAHPMYWELNTTRGGPAVKGGRTIEEGAEKVSLTFTVDKDKNATIRFYVDQTPLLPTPHNLDAFIRNGGLPVETLLVTGTKWSLHEGGENGAELASNALRPWKAPMTCKEQEALLKQRQRQQSVKPGAIAQPTLGGTL